MSVYETEYIEGYQAYQRGEAEVSPYIGDADNAKNTAWNQGWVDAFNDAEGSVGNLMPGGSDTSGQGGGFGNQTITVNPDGTVTSTPRASIAPSDLGSVANGNVAPLPIVGIVNVAGPVNVGGKLYANQASIIDDALDVRLALTGHDIVKGTALIATGLTGSVAAARYVGATATGHPTTGPHLVGDWCPAQDGHIWICTVAGTPGTWVDVTGSGFANPMTTAGDIIYGGTGGTPTRLPTASGVLMGGTPPAYSQAPTLTGEVTAQDFKASGKTGATAGAALGGGTASGAPTTGAHTLGEFVVDQTGSFWICTAAGTPGTWANPGSLTPSQVDAIGLASARPAAASKPVGYIYASTDSKVLERTNGSAWEQIGEWGAGGSSTLAGGSDVSLSGLADLQELQFHGSDSKWHNAGPIRGLLTSPPTGVWSWVNQGSATIDETAGLFLSVPIDNTDTWRGRFKTAPSTPYVIDVYVEPWIFLINFEGFGVGWRNSGSGNMVLFNHYVNTTFGAQSYRLNVGKANTTTITVNYLTSEPPVSAWFPWLRFADDGTNRTCSVSRDGIHWLQIHSVGHTDYITPDQVGFACESRNASFPAAMAILSWREH